MLPLYDEIWEKKVLKYLHLDMKNNLPAPPLSNHLGLQPSLMFPGLC